MNSSATSTGGFIDTAALAVRERKPGWRGRSFDSLSMTFVQYEFDAGASIHEHAHPQEEVWQILEGELEISIGGETRRAGAGFVGIVRPDTRHSVRALTAGKAIVTDFPRRATD
ncbi:MAG: cupin domain-containing protein [Rhizomicrobium sp.]